MNTNMLRRVLVLVSLSLWVASLFFTAVAGSSGLATLAFGWMEVFCVGIVGPFVAFAWLANPLLRDRLSGPGAASRHS